MGWGGVGWDVNVHGTLMMLRCPLGLGWGGVGMNMYIYIYICVCVHACLCQVTHIYIYGYINICIYTCIYVYKNQCTCPSMQGMCLCLVYHVCNTILTYCWLPSVFFRWFAHGLVKPIGNSTKWTQSAVKRKAFEHGAKSMVTESAIRVIEIARCLFSKQTQRDRNGRRYLVLHQWWIMVNSWKSHIEWVLNDI